MNELSFTKSRQPANAGPLSDGGPIGWIRGEIDRLFDDFGRPGQSLFNFEPRATGPLPAMELTDAGKEYRLSAELPGLEVGDVELGVVDGILTISGEKKEETERNDGGVLLSERRYGSFTRQIPLPADVDANAIKARFRHGLLEVTLGKDEKVTARAKKIAIEG